MLSSCSLQPFSCPLSSSLMKFNLPHNAPLFPPTLSLSAGGSSKVFALTWAVRLDKVTAGQFSGALYLLPLLGKSFRARQLSTTIYYHKEDRGEEKTERHTERRGICVGVCACVWGGQCVREVKCSHCKSKAGMKYECSTVQAPPTDPAGTQKKHKYTHSLSITTLLLCPEALDFLFRWLWSLSSSQFQASGGHTAGWIPDMKCCFQGQP